MKLTISVYLDQQQALERGDWAIGGGNVRLFEREVAWPFLPREEDTVHVMHNAEYDEWYGDVDVYLVFFSANGEVLIELTGLVVDPPPEIEAYWRNQRQRLRKVWWTDRDGDPVELLLASGWSEI